MSKILEIPRLTATCSTPSNVQTSKGSVQCTKGALSPMRPSDSFIHQPSIQRSDRRRGDIGSREINIQKIPIMARGGALSGLDAPVPISQEEIAILTDDDVIGNLDFVSILTNRKLSYTRSNSILEPATTPGAVLTDVFRGLREQNAKIIKTLNLLITAEKKNKATITELENKLSDITAATNTLIDSTRMFKTTFMSTDTSIKAIRSHMLLIQDQLKHVTASVNNSVCNGKESLIQHSYNIYGRVYCNPSSPQNRASTPIQTQIHPDNNALTLSALVDNPKDPSPTTIADPVQQTTLPNNTESSLSLSPQDQSSRCALLVKTEVNSNAQKLSPQIGSVTSPNVSPNTNRVNNLLNFNNFKVIPLRQTNAIAKEEITKNMPASLRQLDSKQSSQMIFEQNKIDRVPLATPMESMEAREGHAHDIDITQRLDMLERNLRQITKHLGLTWIN